MNETDLQLESRRVWGHVPAGRAAAPARPRSEGEPKSAGQAAARSAAPAGTAGCSGPAVGPWDPDGSPALLLRH